MHLIVIVKLKSFSHLEGLTCYVGDGWYVSLLIMQVYMASMFERQYKLLARAGNQVQEVKPWQFLLFDLILSIGVFLYYYLLILGKRKLREML